MLQEPGNTSKLPVQGTFDAHRTLSHDMSVNHGGLHIGVSEQFLHRADVVAGLEQITHWHPHSVAALGYLRAIAVGNETPGSRSLRCRQNRSNNFARCWQTGAMTTYPGPLLISLIAVVAFIISAAALTRLGRGLPRDPRRLWRISLFSNLVIVVVVTLGFGLMGFALCLMEMIAIVLHVVALVTPTRITHDP
jgi:hypothetical protein